MPKKQNTVLSCLSVLFLSALSFLLFVTNVTAAHQRSDTSDTLKYLVSVFNLPQAHRGKVENALFVARSK